MTARFLLNLREWDHHMSNPETDQWDIHGGDHHSAIQFQKSEPHTTRWTINDMLGDDPLLKPVESEVNLEDRSPISEAWGFSVVHKVLKSAFGILGVIYFRLTTGVSGTS